mgnify:CR=1 FL=1
MKKMLLNKKNLYIKLTAVLILLIVGILGIYTTFVQKIATGQCFNILDDSRERMVRRQSGCLKRVRRGHMM